jgi:DNA polymerase V
MVKQKFEVINIDLQTQLRLPFYIEGVSCGFPSPADDFAENSLDLNEYLINNPASTFFIRARGESMIDAFINDGDILIVDRSLTPKNNQIVLACIDGEFLIKRLIKKNDTIYLQPCNPAYKLINVTKSDAFQIEGVVTYIIRKTI